MLTSLYLQRNNIRTIENLDNLIRLKKLYLGHNEISVVENLDSLISLEELHVEKQRCCASDSMCFDSECVNSLSVSSTPVY